MQILDYLSNFLAALTEAPANQAWSGIAVPFTYGVSLTPGDAVYFATDGTVKEADANVPAALPCIGVALETASSGVHLVLLLGIYRDDSLFAWSSIGQPVYLSTTAGGLTQTQPAAADDAIQIVGIATHADRLYVNPQLVWITHT